MTVDGREPLLPADHDYPPQYQIAGIPRERWMRFYSMLLISLILGIILWMPLALLIWQLWVMVQDA